MPDTQVVVLEGPEEVAARAAAEFEAAANGAVRAGGRCSVALSGGSTPRAMFEHLTLPEFRDAIDWAGVHVFWSDERCVPPDDPASNFGMAKRTLLDRVPIAAENIHRVKGELEPAAAADDYVKQMKNFFAGPPAFDVVYLGLGPDGHTASLFPGTDALGIVDSPCVATRVDTGVASPWRVTLTYPAINAARRVIFLVVGEDKAAILKETLSGPREPRRLPAQSVAPTNGAVVWLVDAAAAALLSS
jgi:6-phosphogluconolactonase